MHYQSVNSRAGHGYINVSDLPSTGQAGIVKEILQDAGETRIYLECEAHRGCPYCEYAKALVYTYEGTMDVYVRFTTTVTNTSNRADISIDVEASTNSSMSCPTWYNSPIPVEWEVIPSITTDASSGRKTYSFVGKIDGSTVYSTSYDEAAVNNAITSIKWSVEDHIKTNIKNRLTSIISNPLNGVWPQITTSDVSTLVSNANISIKTDDTTSGTIYIPAKQTNGRQVYYSAGATAWKKRTVELTVNKSILNKSNYSNNFFNLPEYDLTGTEFRIYTSSTGGSPLKDIDGNEAVIKITSATGGLSNTVTLSADYANKTVYLEEKLPAKAVGFEKPTSRYPVTLPDAGKTWTANIDNKPMADPVLLKIMKISPLTDGKPIADVDYNGIKYTLSYFGDNETNARNNSSAKDTWVFATKEENDIGQIKFTDESYKVSGPALYKINGKVEYPIGWYRIQENQDQTTYLHNKGLEVSSDIYYVHIIKEGSGSDAFEIYKGSTKYNSPIGNPTIYESREGAVYEGEHWETFSFTKRDIFLSGTGPTGDTTFVGMEFTVYCEDEDVFGTSTRYDGHRYSIDYDGAVLVDGVPIVLTLNSDNGRVSCPYPLPREETVGKRFYIEETYVPDDCGYKDTDYTRCYITWNNSNPTVTYTGGTVTINSERKSYNKGEFYNTPRMGQIIIEKFDDDSNDGKAQGDSSLQGIQFAIVNKSANPVRHPNESYDAARDAVVTIVTTNSNGVATASKLPYGTYAVYELGTGHSLRAGVAYSESRAGSTIYANSSYAFDNTTSPDRYIGTAVIHPDDDSNTSCVESYNVYNPVVRASLRVVKTDTEMSDVQGDADFAGIRYAVVNGSAKSVKVNGTTYAVGDVIYIIETNSSGIAEISAQNSLPYGTYNIYELRSDSGVRVGHNYDSEEKGSSIYANDSGYLFTETVHVAKTSVDSSDYNMASRQIKTYLYHNLYDAEFDNVVSNGKLTVQKFDDDAHEEQGDTSFNGINFAIVNRSTHPVYYENHKCGVGTVVAVHQTQTVDGVNGIAVFNNLPYGKYQVYELGKGATITPNTAYPSDSTDSRLGSTYYANDSYTLKEPGVPNRQVSEIETIHPDNITRVVVVEDEIANTPTRGTIVVNKTDKETAGPQYNGSYQGDADFEGIRYAIVNRSNKFVKIDGTIYPVGSVVGIITTNKEGFAALDATGEYSLPYGTYDIYELRKDATIELGEDYDTSSKLGTSMWANDHGYLYTEDISASETDANTTFVIDKRTQKVYLDKNIYNTAFTNVVAKGTITIQKVDGDLANAGDNQGDASLAGIKYAVINRSAKFIERFGEFYEPGEIVDIRSTDANGLVKFDTDGNYTFPYGTYEVVELRYDNTLSKHDIYDGNSKIGTSSLANASYVFTEDKTVAEVGANTVYNVESKQHILREPKSTYEPEFSNYTVKGTIVVNKQDVETIWAQGDEDFANIRYAIVNRSARPIERNGVMYNVGEVIAIIKTNHDGVARLDEEGKYTLPYGTYEIFELRNDATIVPGETYNGSTKLGESIYANSTGFLYTNNVAITKVNTTTSDQFQMASQNEQVRTLKETYTHIFQNAPAKGTLTLIKYDANLTDRPILDNSNKEFKQGDANTAGIQYAIINVSKDPVTGEPRKVMYKGTLYDVNSIIDILTVREEDNYEARLDREGEFSLNYGTYWVYELRKDHQLQIGDSYPVDNPTDPVLGTSLYSNDNGYMHNDKESLDKSAIVKITDVNGNEVDDYSKYEVSLREPVIHKAQTRFDYAFFNYPARGEILINKFDDETDLQKIQGNSHFIGIKYAIVNKSAVHIYYKNQVFEPGEVIDIVTLDDNGKSHVIDVPYGTYDIHELRRDATIEIGDIYNTPDKLGESIYANEYYLYCDEVFTKKINVDTPVYTVESHLGDEVRIAGEVHEYKYSNVPIRSDFEHNKVDIDGNRMQYIPFSISLLDDSGEILETHVIITDKDGYLNTQTRPKNPATVNSLDQYYDKEHGRYVGPLDEAAGEVNIWFGNIEDYYDLGVISNNRGSLLAGTYYVQELYCENNLGQDMLRHTFDAFEEGALNEPKNISVDLNIIMKSDAYDYGTDSKTLSISKTAKIRDTVDITHLKTYNEYKIITEAVNVRKDGSWVTLGFSEPYIFTPEPYDETMTTYGTYDVIAIFDTTSAEPGTYVGLIDRLYQKIDGIWTEEPIRIHNGDLTDEKQMLLVPDLTTSATNIETGSLIGSIEPATAASDKIIYKHLGDRSFFNMEVLVVNEEGQIINDVEGNPCRQSYFLYTNNASSTKVERVNNVFTSPTSGEINLHEFGLKPFIVGDEYDTIGMVVNLYDATTGEVVLSHNTKMDEADEIIKYLRLSTTASDNTGYLGVVPCSKEAEVIDVIKYTNLVKSSDVTVAGALIDKTTGDIVTTATRKFSLTEGSGEISLKFAFDSTPYAGKELVVFERVYLNCDGKEVLISKHEDINDKSQTVSVPKLETSLMNVHNGENYKVVSAVEEAVSLVDYVEYTGLVPGDPWTLTATLMNAATGEPVLDASGNVVKTTHTFTPTLSSGVEQVKFNFITKRIYNQSWKEDISWVCFEDLKSGTEGRENISYATHADLEDGNQTVFIPKFITEAVNKANHEHIIKAAKNQTIVDTVEFRNFVSAVKEGQKFTLEIEAIDAKTGESIVNDKGEPYINTKLFTWNGQITESIELTIDASNLAGKTIVFFETLYYGDSTSIMDRVLVENDLDSTAQSVVVPDVRTVAVDKVTNTKNLSTKKIILDKVMLSGIYTDTDYIIKTMIVDKATGEFIKTLDGDEYIALTTFHSTKNSTSSEVNILLDVSNTEDLSGKDIVIYEYVYMADANTKFEDLNDSMLIAKHTDINDTNQTIEVPSIGTTAVDKADGDHIVDGTQTEQTIIDTVAYNNLIVGKKYTVTGRLAIKPSKDNPDNITYVTDNNGNILESSVEFTPITPNGTVDVPFTLNASDYAGKQLVAFETLSYEDVDVVVHADIEDKAQTVFVSLILHVNIAKADFEDVNYFLKGAEITIFNGDGTVAKDIYGNDCIGLTDENGAVDFVVLYYDADCSFYAMETKAPEGYQLCYDKFPVGPSEDKESLGTDLIKLNILDEVIIIPPDTGDRIPYIVFGALGIGVLGLSILFIVKKTKKKKEQNDEDNSNEQ